MKRTAAILFSVLFSILTPIEISHADTALVPYEPCEKVNQAPCIESLTLIDSNGKRIKAIPG